MKKVATFVTLILAIGWSICPAEGFIPLKSLALVARGLSFSTKNAIVHPEMTRNAILKVAAELLRDNPNPNDRQGSIRRIAALSNDFDEKKLITAYYDRCDRTKRKMFENAVEAVQKANSDVDFGEEEMLAPAHFDAEQFESGQNRLIALRQSVVSSIKAGNYVAARMDMGRMFHTLQDFYSHSNWIENDNEVPNPVLGQPDKRIENVAGSTQQTCTDCASKTLAGRTFYECNDNIIESIKENKILTSGYVGDTKDKNGDRIEKVNGKCSHGGFQMTDSEQDLPARGGINKDSPYQMVSPHHYLHFNAASVAQQATIDMLRDLRRNVDNDKKFGEYLGVFESQAFAEKRLTYSRNRNAMLQHWKRINEGKAV
jgi:hypothetical protein